MTNPMLVALLMNCAIGAGAEVKVVGEVKTVAVPKGGAAYWTQDAGVALSVKGPGALVVEVRDKGPAAPTTITIVRDERWRADKRIVFKANKAKAPKGFLAHGQMAIKLPPGAHTVRVTSDRPVLVLPRFVKKLPKPIVPTPETSIIEEGGAVAALGQADASPPDSAAALPQLAPLAEAAVSPDPAPQAAPQAAAPEATPASAPVPEATPASPPVLVPSVASVIASGASPAGDGATSLVPPLAPSPERKLAQALRVAVYDFELQGVEPNVGAVVTDSVLGEVRKLQGIYAIGTDEIRAMLSHEANKQFLGCESNESCLAEIAGALGVDNLISGKLARVDDGAVFLVRRIDQGRAKVVGVFDRRVKAESGQEYLALIGPAIAELFPEYALREGAVRGVPKDVALRLDPPPLPKWSFFTVAGGAVAAAAVGGFFGVQARSSAALFEKRVQDSLSQVIPAREVSDLDRDARLQSRNANYAFLGAGIMALTAGVMALFTDWHGYGDAAVTQQR